MVATKKNKMKKTIKIFLPVLFSLIVNAAFSQGEGNNWHFGCFSGITFNTLTPSVIPSSLQSREGVASMSDMNGNLLFYTDGQSIFNNIGTQVVSNLLGHPSSTSSAIIVPKSGSTTNFWIFTVDVINGINGINYYEYNSSTQALIGGGTNLVSSSPTTTHTEKITAVKKCGESGYWVCTIKKDGLLEVYNVSTTVSLNSTFSTGTTLTPRNGTGYLKFSRDGKFLAHAIPMDPTGILSFRGIVNLYDFDNVTGSISNPTSLDFTNDGTGNAIGQPYGIEFSNSSNYLYVSILANANRPIDGGEIYQFDLTASPINSSRTFVGQASTPNVSYGALQMGPDGVIYLAMEDGNENTSSCACFSPHQFLGAINDPDMLLGTPNFTQDAISLTTTNQTDICNNTSTGGVKIGLPTFISSIFNTNIEITNTCKNQNTGKAIIQPNQNCNSPFSFTWSNGFSEIGVNQSEISGLSAGIYSVTTIDNSGYQIVESFTIDDIPCGCCPLPNLINNGDFENPYSPLDFSSQYQYSPLTLLPAQFSIINNTQVSKICSNWNVDDMTSTCDGLGNFMVVNGETTQPTNLNNIIWEKTITGIEPGSQYKFCALIKNLPQCCFDVNPKIKIEITPGANLPWTTISTNNSDPCDWQAIELNFTATVNSVNIKLFLEEATLGDGNDLAIDNISLHKLPQSNVAFTHELQPINSTTGQLTASINTLTNLDDNLPGQNCKYAWVIGKLSSITPPVFQGFPSFGGSIGNLSWGLTTTFPGFPINTNQPYLIYLYVYDCDCQTTGFEYHIAFKSGRMRKLTNREENELNKKIQELIENEIKKERKLRPTKHGRQ